jgi:hypothetical protein
MIGLLHMLNKSHQSKVNPAAAPRRGVMTIEPLPTTLPVTITLGPIYLSLPNNELGGLFIECI